MLPLATLSGCPGPNLPSYFASTLICQRGFVKVPRLGKGGLFVQPSRELLIDIFTENKDDDPFARPCAQVGMHADYRQARDSLNAFLQPLSAAFQEFGPDLLDQLCAFRLYELLFRRGQDPLEPHDGHVPDQVGFDVGWPSSHVLALEIDHGLADQRFYLALGFSSHRRAPGVSPPAEYAGDEPAEVNDAHPSR